MRLEIIPDCGDTVFQIETDLKTYRVRIEQDEESEETGQDRLKALIQRDIENLQAALEAMDAPGTNGASSVPVHRC